MFDVHFRHSLLIYRCGRCSPVCSVLCFTVSLAVWQVSGSFPFHAVTVSFLHVPVKGSSLSPNSLLACMGKYNRTVHIN